MNRSVTRAYLTALFLTGALLGQPGPGPEGHWEGAIETPKGDLKFAIDLKPDAGKGWIGTITIPAQNVNALDLINITATQDVVSFGIKAPGDPSFQGKLDGPKLNGELSQGGANLPFHLTRSGEAKIEVRVPNAPVSKELEGTWEGTLNAGQELRLKMVFTNKDGAGNGVMFSLDQGNSEISITRITQTESRVKLELSVIGGRFEGELKGTQMTGEWTQGGGAFPLTFTKAAK